MIDLDEEERLRESADWLESVFPDHGDVEGRITQRGSDALDAVVKIMRQAADALLTTAREAVALRERVAELEGALAAATKLLNLTKALLDDANAAERDALEIVESLVEDACSLGCPSTGREGVPIPHTERCDRARAALRHDQEEKKDGRR